MLPDSSLPLRWKRITALAAVNAGMVLGVKLLLGPLLLQVVEPKVGGHWATLIEIPLMVIAVMLIAHWLITGPAVSLQLNECLAMGGLAAGMLVVIELTIIGLLGQGTVADFFTKRDFLSAIAYYGTLAVVFLGPWFLKRKRPT